MMAKIRKDGVIHMYKKKAGLKLTNKLRKYHSNLAPKRKIARLNDVCLFCSCCEVPYFSCFCNGYDFSVYRCGLNFDFFTILFIQYPCYIFNRNQGVMVYLPVANKKIVSAKFYLEVLDPLIPFLSIS